MKKKEIKALMVVPGEHPKEVMLENNLDALQKAVSIGCDYQGLIPMDAVVFLLAFAGGNAIITAST